MTITESLRTSRLIKEGLWIVCGQIASVIGSLVLIRILTEYLEPEQYGHLALGLTIAGLVNQVVMGGLTAGISRFFSIAAEKNDLPGYISASQRLIFCATVAVLVIGLVSMMGLFLLGYSEWMGLAIAAFVLSLVSGYSFSVSAVQSAARQRAIVALHVSLDSWLKIFFAVGAMLCFGRFSTAVILGYALSSLLTTGSQLFYLKRLINSKKSQSHIIRDWGRQIWGYSWPFSVFGIFTWMQLSSDRWALQIFSTEHEVGLYAVVFQLGYVPIGLFMGMAMNFLGPILYQSSGSATDRKRNMFVHRIAWKITFAGLLITVVAFILTLFLHEWLFKIFVAKKYQTVSNLLPWMVFAGGIFSAGQMLALKLMSEMKSSVMTAAKIVTAIFGVVLNIYGASRFGLQGVAAALVAFSIIYFIWMSWLAKYPPTLVIK